MMPAYERCDLEQLRNIPELQILFLKNGNSNTFFMYVLIVVKIKIKQGKG